MWQFFRASILGLAVFTIGIATASAARWGPHGHSEITYDTATGDGWDFRLPADIAKVIALGSLAPDFFEFDVPAAHAQVDDPGFKFEHGRLELSLSESGYRDLQSKAYKRANRWHEFYFNAAVTAMQRGQREQAAFLLGYAMHNMEDFGTHQGMANIVHAAMDADEISPDTASPDISRRLALSHEGASVDLARFRRAVGPENWHLFRGERVQRSDDLILEPGRLLIFGKDLERWDPRSGVLPVSADSSWLRDPVRRAFDLSFRKIAPAFGYHAYSVDLSGHEHDKVVVMMYNFSESLLMRQDKMLAFLDASRLGIHRGVDDPQAPQAKDTGLLLKYFMEAFDFAYREPRRWKALSAEGRSLLESTNWLDVGEGEERLEAARLENEVAELSGKLIFELRDRIRLLENSMNSDIETLAWIQAWRVRLQQANASWDREEQLLRNLRQPTIDARPQPEPPLSFYTSIGRDEQPTQSRPSRPDRDDRDAIDRAPRLHSLGRNRDPDCYYESRIRGNACRQ